MDNIILKTQKYELLRRAAALSALQLLEDNEYIKLAMCNEQYFANPTEELLEKMKVQLSVVLDKFPKFIQIRQSLVTVLLNTGHMTVDSPQSSSPTELQEVVEQELTVVEEPPKPIPNNVVSIFSKRKPNPNS